MNSGILHTVLSSLKFYRKQAIYQLVIIAILASVITGSLLTGYSVRKSLTNSVSYKLGKSDLVITTGQRYFTPSLAKEFEAASGLRSTAITESSVICQNFATGERVLRAKIFGVGTDFFGFNGYSGIEIEKGTVAVNSALARRLNLKKGDEVIITFNPLSDVPASSPFAPSAGNSDQGVFKVSGIIPADSCGNFSLGISQASPENIFINNDEIYNRSGIREKANRILAINSAMADEKAIAESLRNSLSSEDMGLNLRRIDKTGETEIISSRVFIDRDLADDLEKVVPDLYPVLTYLVNSISFGQKSAPYSFVTASDRLVNEGSANKNAIVINRWLADDIGARVHDTISLTWFNPGKVSELEEKTEKFVVSRITDISGPAADSLLMPEFPGIAGKESCTDWDAGVEIKMDRIRQKDEDYWNRYKGTPKAFISYEKGIEIWGSNFGPATSLRSGYTAPLSGFKDKLKGKIDPDKAGFTIRYIRNEMMTAANESVDFSTLFLSLGFFIIASAVLLLVLAVRSWFESRRDQVYTLYAIGFRNTLIGKMLLLETGLIALAGSFSGAFAGVGVNYVIVIALNSVWTGAVQTDSINALPGTIPIIAGFISALLISLIVLYISISRFLKKLAMAETGEIRFASPRRNLILLILSSILFLTIITFYFLDADRSVELAFGAGAFSFISFILFWRQLVISGRWSPWRKADSFLSSSYYKFHTGRLIMPVILIAAGIFAVVITGINRMKAGEGSLLNSGGTGGYRIWAETTVPVKENLNTVRGMKTYGLDEFAGKFEVVQGKRSSGDDASCLNLNHVTSPALLGIDPLPFITAKAFSFSTLIKDADKENPWEIITRRTGENIIYGFADQTVLEWGLKKKTGDTLDFRSEAGRIFRLVIAGGLKSSVFQGMIITDARWISEFYPSVSGSSVFLFKCEYPMQDKITDAIRTRFEPFGVTAVPASEKLEEFFEVTNTYLTVFTVLGGFGVILGVAGLGFVLRMNYNSRRKEFALMLSAGFTAKRIRRMVLKEQFFILITGLSTGIISGIISTLPSLSSGGEIGWLSLAIITSAIAAAGGISLLASLRSIGNISLISSLRKE